MATTISKPGKGSHLRRSLRSLKGNYLRRRRDSRARTSEAYWTRSIPYGGDRTLQDGKPRGASSLSAFVFAGAAQLAAIPLISAGASVAVVVLTVLVINLRLTLYSASLAPHFRRLPAGWKGLLSYLLTDQAYAATITRFDDGQTEEPDKRWYYLGAALAIWVTWQAATMLGVFLGSSASGGWCPAFLLPLVF